MSDFETFNLRDERLNPKATFSYPVLTGSASITPQEFASQSATTSSVQVNIVVPSFETCVDRRVRIVAQITMQNIYTLGASTDDTKNVMQVGSQESLCSYPLNSQISNMICNLNNQALQINSSDVLPMFKQLYNDHETQLLNSGCPNQRDTYANYTDGQFAINNPCGSYGNTALDCYYSGNGSWPIDYTVQYKTAATGAIVPAVPKKLANPNSTLQSIRTECGLAALGFAAGDQVIVNLTFKTEEPLIGLSPFTYIAGEHPAIYGINNLNFLFNFLNANRMWRSALYGPAGANTQLTSSTFTAINSCAIRVVFLSPKDNMLMPKRSISEYYQVVPYKSSVKAQVVGDGLAPEPITASSVQLNCIFDTLLIGIQRTSGKRAPNHPDSFLPIDKINITFNNQAGLMSTCNNHDLYELSRKYGGIGQNYAEFKGYATGANTASTGGNTGYLSTVGSVIAIKPILAMAIDQSYYAPGSIGAFNLQVTVTPGVLPKGQTLLDGEYELVLTVVNSGIVSVESGVANTYIAILNKADVSKVADEPVRMSNEHAKRLIGGGWLDSLGSHVSNAINIARSLAPVAKMALNATGNDNAAKIASMMGQVGLGVGAGVGYGTGAGRDQRLR